MADLSEKLHEENVLLEEKNPSTENKAEKNKVKVGKKKQKKLVKRIVLGVVAVLLIIVCIFCLGKRNVGWAKKISDTIHLDKIPGIEGLTNFTHINSLFNLLGIGEDVQVQGEATYQVYKASKRTVQKMLTGTGTLKPLDEYTVTALSSGEILEDYFEEGDAVEEDQLLMKIDSASLETSLDRANNSYKDALDNLNDLRESKEDLYVKSDYSGVVQVFNFEVGDSVRSGDVVASVIDRDKMLVDIPFMQSDAFNIKKGDMAILTAGNTFEEIHGTVEKIEAAYTVNSNGVKTVNITISVTNPGAITENVSATARVGEYTCTDSAYFYYNVNETISCEVSGEIERILKNEGDYINAGEAVLVIDSEDLDKSIEKAERNVKDAKNALDDAEEAFEKYEITAPISGTVVEKNYKKGEKIGSSSGGSTIAVIYDLSALVFDMNIDELDIDSVSVGQAVKITSDAKPGMSYTGEITKISVQGNTSNGTTYYPITVTVYDYGKESGNALRPGMNIDAEIIIKEAVDVIAIPVDAVGRGNKVTVVKRLENDKAGQTSEDETRPQNSEETKSARGGYTTVPNTVETEVVVVETGISDDSYIEIVSGLNEGDMVVVQTATAPNTQNFMGMMSGMPSMGGGMSGMGTSRPSGMGGGMPGGR